MMKINIDTTSPYFKETEAEFRLWRINMQKRPTLLNKAAKGVQTKINEVIPDKVHKVVTKAIKEMTRAVLFGAEFTTKRKPSTIDHQELEASVRKQIRIYSSSSAAEGAITGFGGFISGMADFPLWLSIKMKMLFAIANAYNIDLTDYRERLYILHIFQLTFSSRKHKNQIFRTMDSWDEQVEMFPRDINDFDWRTFQLEYRDFIDLAKLLQLIPGIGAIAGAYINHKYTRKLGNNALNAYRLRMHEYKLK